MMKIMMSFEKPLLLDDGVGPLASFGIALCCYVKGAGPVLCCSGQMHRQVTFLFFISLIKAP